jgi:hypothetical protein
MLPQGPDDVLAHQRRRMIPPLAQGPEDARRRRCIAQRHGQIAQPAVMTDAPDRRALGAPEKLRLIPAEKRHQLRRMQTRTRPEITLPRQPRTTVLLFPASR